MSRFIARRLLQGLVLVCLVALPQDCPPGDDRGKTYAAANLRTLGAWSAADSEHMCGGA